MIFERHHSNFAESNCCNCIRNVKIAWCDFDLNKPWMCQRSNSRMYGSVVSTATYFCCTVPVAQDCHVQLLAKYAQPPTTKMLKT